MVLDVDATLVTSHSEKGQAAPTLKGGLGYHPLAAWCDNTQEILAVAMRAGNAGLEHRRRPATLPTRTRRPPSGSSVTFTTRNPGRANSNAVRSITGRGSLQLTALGTNTMSRPRASILGAGPPK